MKKQTVAALWIALGGVILFLLLLFILGTSKRLTIIPSLQYSSIPAVKVGSWKFFY
jgi:hypothetical protein